MTRLQYLVLFIALMLPWAMPVSAQIASSPVASQTQRPDGSLLDWHLQTPDGLSKHGIFVVMQGSGCLSVASNSNITAVSKLLPDFAVLTVEKYGVMPGDKPEHDHEDCPSPVYYSHNTVTQRVEDYQRVIADLKTQSWWNGQLVLFGGSEGGDVAAILTSRVQADIAVLFSTGGGVTFGEAVRLSVPEEGWPTIDAMFARIRANPESLKIISGSSIRWWADTLDRRVADDMLKAQTALLLVQGGSDTSVPVSVSRAAVDLFAEQGRCNLTYWEFPAYDHIMSDQAGNPHLEEVLGQITDWVRGQLFMPSTAACMKPE